MTRVNREDVYVLKITRPDDTVPCPPTVVAVYLQERMSRRSKVSCISIAEGFEILGSDRA